MLVASYLGSQGTRFSGPRSLLTLCVASASHLDLLSESNVINPEDPLTVWGAWPRGNILLNLVSHRKAVGEKVAIIQANSLDRLRLEKSGKCTFTWWERQLSENYEINEENNWILNVRRYDELVSKYLNAIKIKIDNVKFFCLLSHPFFL